MLDETVLEYQPKKDGSKEIKPSEELGRILLKGERLSGMCTGRWRHHRGESVVDAERNLGGMLTFCLGDNITLIQPAEAS